jgi:uncharacterized protein YndB with AHSA1/START domain
MPNQSSIEKEIDLKAPVSRVWKAITDHHQFGEWFRVNLEGPFVEGQPAAGQITWPAYTHVRMTVTVQKITPETYFSYTWHPYAMDPTIDYAKEPPTLVEFILTPTATGTHLKVIESGFEKLSAARRAEAFPKNDGGWAQQMTNIETYVTQNP